MIQKPLLLVFPFGYLSHYLRCITLCRHFEQHFDVRFASHKAYNRFVEQAGFKVFACDTIDEAEVLDDVRKFSFSWLTEANIERVFLSQVQAIQRYQPAAVLGDAVTTLKMAAAYTGVHHIGLINGYMSKHYTATRPLSKTHPVYPLLKNMPASVRDFFTQKGEAIAFREVHRPFRKIRARYGLPPASTFLDELEGDQTLICDLPDLFAQAQLPEGYTTVGPLVYSEEGTEKSPVLQPGIRTIYVSMGSTGAWRDVAFLNELQYSGFQVVTAGDHDRVLNGAHIIPCNFVNAAELMPFADLVICHGGNGTLYQALAYGVPVLCKPGFFEQEWNAAAIEAAGLGTSLDRVAGQDIYTVICKWIDMRNSLRYSMVSTAMSIFANAMPEKVAAVARKALAVEQVAEPLEV